MNGMVYTCLLYTSTDGGFVAFDGSQKWDCQSCDLQKTDLDHGLSLIHISITFTDNGLGMTEEEVDEYINQIAFSGAQDFLNKYKDCLLYTSPSFLPA